MFGTGDKSVISGPASGRPTNTAAKKTQNNAHVNGLRRAGNGMKSAQNNRVDPFDELDRVGSVDKNANTVDAPVSLSRAQSSPPLNGARNDPDLFGELGRMLPSAGELRRNTTSGTPSKSAPVTVRRTVSCEDPFSGLGFSPDKNDMTSNNSKTEAAVNAVDPDEGVQYVPLSSRVCPFVTCVLFTTYSLGMVMTESDPFSVIDCRNRYPLPTPKPCLHSVNLRIAATKA